MKELVLITGARGMLAGELARQLEKDYEIRFLTRKKTQENEYEWDIESDYIDPKALVGVKNIIHLAGASIGSQRWTKKRKQTILSSRVDTARLLLNELIRQNHSIDTFISISAIGYYGSKTSTGIHDETSTKGNDFLANVCFEWEKAAELFKTKGVAKRVAIARSGIILSEKEGVLSKLIMAVKYGLGAGLGTGKQYLPWIHVQDLAAIFKFIIDNKNISGTFNAVAPHHVTNIEFTNTVVKILDKRIFLPKIPGWALQFFLGEMSQILLEGSKVSPAKLSEAGFKFKFDKLSKAVSHLTHTT